MPAFAFADEVYRDRYGDVIGSSTQHGDTTDFWDRYGDYAGSQTRHGDGQVTIRDKFGNVVGEIERDDD